MTRIIFRLLAGICCFCATAGAADFEFTVTLPTPLDHYKTYNVQAAELDLMAKMMNDLNPETRKKVEEFMQSRGNIAKLPLMQPDLIINVIRENGLLKYKPEALEVFLHSSQVLDVIPEQFRESLEPVVHDALLAFFDGLPLERMLDRIEELVKAKDASRGEKILILASKIPTLQKVGQIIGHMSVIPPDIQKSLQSLEMGISTMTRDEMVAYITKDVGEDKIRKHDVQFADKILAEASVGAVIRGSFAISPGTPRHEFVCKIVKPYVQVYLPQELEILSALIDFAGKHADFYDIKGFDLKDFFSTIRDQLSREIQITIEQQNLGKAYEFYRNNKRVKVPKIHPFSTEHVTFMEFLPTQKLTESFPGDRERNAILAARLAAVVTLEAMFAKPRVAIFHGDPHGGNILRLTDDPNDPYRLAMLDWGLMGEFPRKQRVQIVHLNLAMQKRNKKNMMKNIGSLIRGGLPGDPGRLETIDRLVSQTLGKKGGSFELFADLLEQLLKNGFPLDDEMSLFIKAQVTVAGILKTLDPTLSQDEMVKRKVKSLVMREFPKRVLLFPAWNYRGYRSMLSNGDVFSYAF